MYFKGILLDVLRCISDVFQTYYSRCILDVFQGDFTRCVEVYFRCILDVLPKVYFRFISRGFYQMYLGVFQKYFRRIILGVFQVYFKGILLDALRCTSDVFQSFRPLCRKKNSKKQGSIIILMTFSRWKQLPFMQYSCIM